MVKDRRAAQRHAVNGIVRIQGRVASASLARDCRLTDISDSGVRLFAEGVDVPDEFIIFLGADGIRRECRVVWRLGHEVGAEFTDTAERGFGQSVASARSR